MSRQLLAEKMFLFIVSDNLDTKYKNKEYYGLVTSYVDIMKAQFVVYSPNILTKITPDIGTVIHVAPREEIDELMQKISNTIRYIGYINCTEGVIMSPCSTYVGIPVSNNYMQDIPPCVNMWKIVYPHITLVPPLQSTDIKSCMSMIGKSIEFQLQFEYTTTANTRAHHALIHGEEYHVTRWVTNGRHPSCAALELKQHLTVTKYMNLVGYPVFM